MTRYLQEMNYAMHVNKTWFTAIGCSNKQEKTNKK